MNMNRNRGMSLAELMIALALGLMLTLGIATLFTQTRQSFGQDEQIANMQSGLRFAMEELVRDVTMAGFWGGVIDPTDVEAVTASDLAVTGCGADWAVTLIPPLGGVNNATPGNANSAFPCIAAGTFREGTDVIAIKRTRGHVIPTPGDVDCEPPITSSSALDANIVYLADNGTAGRLWRPADADDTSGLGGCVENRQLAPVIYYIRTHSVTAGDGIPTLCRFVLQAGAMLEECLVEGIENLQLEYGIDFSGDGVANQYISAPNAAQFDLVTSVRIHLLARSVRPQVGYTNPKTYVMGDVSIAPNDTFFRRAATTTVVLRNPTNLRNLGL